MSTYRFAFLITLSCMALVALFAVLSNVHPSAPQTTTETVCSTGTTGFGALPAGTVITVAPTKPGTVACWSETHH